MTDPLPNVDCMGSFVHCGLCGKEWKEDKEINTKCSPRDYARISVGWTKQGLQIWCVRHDCNILHIDFEGAQHPANTTRQKSKEELT